MKKLTHIFLILLASIPTLLYGQNESQYLAGAVPMVNDKVVFSREIDLPGASKDAIYDRIHSWMEKSMKKNQNDSRIVYAEKPEGIVAGLGTEYLVFTAKALSLDRALINYQITATCTPGKCALEIEKIRYVYQEKDKFTAEEYISDEIALNKDKTKIYRGYKKFRVKTVDFANELFDEAQAALGVQKAVVTTPSNVQPPLVTSAPVTTTPVVTTSAATAPVVAPVTVSNVSSTELQGYKQIAPDKIPGNIIKMLNENWMLITAGNDSQFNMMTASWGGLGVLYGKPIATCFINPTRFTYQLMEKNDTYTFTFYTEAYRDALKYCGSNSGKNADKVKGSGLTPITTPQGSKAFSEAWLIIECKKLVSQSLMPEAISDPAIKEEWTGKQLHKMFIGEIINVWVK
ncbi:DUF4468 domain-containing protein [Bacteroides sp. 224]|uniref:DUF4468 domain-containing protein n=1 Tax=Bacteroides sp. 224 TaxID=2302936 RepID=UPI0013D44845|nr:DUF4468 domain-containing protein [Bacteroides sp. 224]NDV66169.1 DUF4468 domain-containing protein [Bacteroides sp. 224]